MAVTLRELFNAAHDELDYPSADLRAAALDAAGSLAATGRALDRLYDLRPREQLNPEQRPAETHMLSTATLAAAVCWPHATGPVSDLLGVTADAIATQARSLNDRHRWAISVELAGTARRAVDTARTFPPYSRIPHLGAVRDAAVACEQRAAQRPEERDPAGLDLVTPGPSNRTGLASVIDAAAALHRAAATLPPRAWRMTDVVMTVNAAHLLAAHAAARAAHRPTVPGAHPWHRPALAAPDAWRAARLHCRPFDDATKSRPPNESPVASAAARLGRNLIDQFGPTPAPGVPVPTAPKDDQARTTALATAVTLLPDIASRLSQAAYAFGHTGRLWADPRSLQAFEDHPDLGIRPAAGAAIVEPRDLEQLITSLHLAGDLTTAVAGDLHELAPARLPDLLRSRQAATTSAPPVLSAMAANAHDAARHAAMVRNPHEWGAPRPSQLPGPSRGR